MDKQPAGKDLQRWSAKSPLYVGHQWYGFAVDLVGEQEANITMGSYSGGGTHECLQNMLNVWNQSTTDHSWQTIINALTEIKKFRVIDSIEDECLDLRYVPKKN